MTPRIVWPDGYRTRPATPDDAEVIHDLVSARGAALHGQVLSDPGRIAAVFTRPGLDPVRDTLLALTTEGEPAGWAWVNRRSEVDVHPRHRGRRLGAALLDWTVARADGQRLVQTVPDADHAEAALLRSRGFAPMVTSWLLEIALPTEPELPSPPPGVEVRPLRPGDETDAYRVCEGAFDEWQQRRKSYPEWAAHTVSRDTFAASASPAAFAGGQMIGVVVSLDLPEAGEGYIERLAVQAGHRGRGIARLLLLHAFRDFHRRGYRSCVLWTHSDTGALSLYQRVGMTVRRSSTVFARRP